MKKIVKTSTSFRNVVANGAIDGLKEFSKDKDTDIVVDIANFLIENTIPRRLLQEVNCNILLYPNFLLQRIVVADVMKRRNAKLKEMNQKVFSRLLELLKDKRRKVKINACKAIADGDVKAF